MEDTKVPIDKVEGYNCFACGTANPIGLKLSFYHQGGYVCSDVTLDKNYEGWENMAHGGIISTLLDEVMSWTIIYFIRDFFVTKKMQVRYIRPVPLGRPLLVRGKIIQSDQKEVRAKAEIIGESNKILARAQGDFVLVPKERLVALSEKLKEDMERLFKKLEEPASLKGQSS